MSWELECECTNTHILESPHHLLPSGNGLCSGQAWAWILTWHLKSVVLLQKQWLLWLKLGNLSALHGHPLQSIPPHHFTPKMLDTDDHEAISPCFLLFLTHLLFINAFLKDSLPYFGSCSTLNMLSCLSCGVVDLQDCFYFFSYPLAGTKWILVWTKICSYGDRTLVLSDTY